MLVAAGHRHGSAEQAALADPAESNNQQVHRLTGPVSHRMMLVSDHGEIHILSIIQFGYRCLRQRVLSLLDQPFNTIRTPSVQRMRVGVHENLPRLHPVATHVVHQFEELPR